MVTFLEENVHIQIIENNVMKLLIWINWTEELLWHLGPFQYKSYT